MTEYTQPALFPIEAVQIEGYAQPETRDDETDTIVDDEPRAEAA